MNRLRRWQLEFIRVAILLVTVGLVWCVTLRKFDRANWNYLPGYLGDAWNYAAWAKATNGNEALSEDLNHGQDYDGVTGVNPFRHLTALE